MGMDVYGKAPKSEEGKYFRASIWTWPGVLEAIASTKVLPDDLVEQMSYNSGAGPDDALAVTLADALEKACEGLNDEHIYITDDSHYASVGTAGMGSGLLTTLGQAFPDAKVQTTESAYSTPVWKVREFAKFARESGGFEVW